MISLGPLREKNLDLYFRARNHLSVRRWCRQYDLLTEGGHRAWFDGLHKRSDVSMYEILAWDDPVGACGFTSIDHVNQRAEFSLYVFPDHMGKGHGASGLKLLLEHGFDDLNLMHIWGETFEDNPAAKIFERLGMKKEGTRRKFYFREGRFIDAYLYSILRSEWHANIDSVIKRYNLDSTRSGLDISSLMDAGGT
jgi:hypothetical protein